MIEILLWAVVAVGVLCAAALVSPVRHWVGRRAEVKSRMHKGWELQAAKDKQYAEQKNQYKVQAQEHEVLSPEFLDWLREAGDLGHTATCQGCRPSSVPEHLQFTSEAFEDNLREASLTLLSGDADDDRCATYGHRYELGSCDCVACGQCRMEPRSTEWFPGWGV